MLLSCSYFSQANGILILSDQKILIPEKYECDKKITFKITIPFIGEATVECTGTGKSDNSATEACERAQAAVVACIETTTGGGGKGGW